MTIDDTPYDLLLILEWNLNLILNLKAYGFDHKNTSEDDCKFQFLWHFTN